MLDELKAHGAITGDNHAALWHGRFNEGPDAPAVEFETSIYIDDRMAHCDIAGSKAHAQMLFHSGIISQKEESDIVSGLDKIDKALKAGSLEIDRSAEDIHSFIESALTDMIGDTAKKLHTGRSRNDQVALDERLYLKQSLSDLEHSLSQTISCLADIAEKHTETLMPGYTHMQHAQPVTLGHHLCAWAWALFHDRELLQCAVRRMDKCPLGAGALAGSTLPLDRDFAAKALGFSDVTENSIETVSSRDCCLEAAFVLSMIQVHLSRFCEEIVLWSSAEFGFIELSEKWSTGSSIMPQKKNPDFAELIRGRTGRVFGDLFALFTMIKGLPLSYNRDMQEDKTSLFDAYDTVLSNLAVFRQMIATASWNEDRMASACEDGYLNATDAAEYLVKKGMPFRSAHEASALAVKKAIEKKIRLSELPLEDFKACSDLFEGDIYGNIDIKTCVKSRSLKGGPAAESVKRQIEMLRAADVDRK